MYPGLGAPRAIHLALRLSPSPAPTTTTAAAPAPAPASARGAPYSTGEKVAIAAGIGIAGTFLYLAFKK
jgi:hypothetical protein